MHAIHCFGSMIMGSNQHYRWVLEVKWSLLWSVGQTQTREVKYLLLQFFRAVLYWSHRSNQMSERKTKDNIAIPTTSRIIYKISIALSVLVLLLLIIQWDVFKSDYIHLILNLRLNNPLQRYEPSNKAFSKW